jgi:hypothetical protein
VHILSSLHPVCAHLPSFSLCYKALEHCLWGRFTYLYIMSTTPTQSSHRDQSDIPRRSIERSTSALTVYIVVDTCYPTKASFDSSLGKANIDSAHSTMHSANSRAKKIIYENDAECTVDIDKIIEETRQGLYTGIGIGGKENSGCEDNSCAYARKCEVESKIVDEDSEDDGEMDMS